MDTLDPGRHLNLTAVPNMRDIGGYQTADGRRVRNGLVFRAGQLDHLDAEAVTTFGQLGIRSVFDLRTERERATGADGDHVLQDVEIAVFDVLADEPEGGAAKLGGSGGETSRMMEILGDGKAAAILEKSYRGFVTLTSAHVAYRGLFTALADDGTGPAVFHCTAGKDRTGWATAVLLTHLGVDDDTVLTDYLESNVYALPSFQPFLDSFESKGGDPAALRPILEVKAEYLDAALADMRSQFGDVDGYLRRGLGLDDTVLDRLRTRLLEG